MLICNNYLMFRMNIVSRPQLRGATTVESSLIAERAADIAAATIRSDTPIRFTFSPALAIAVPSDSDRRDAWLIVARQDAPPEQIAPVVVMVLEPAQGDVLAVSVGIDDPAAGCAFNLRRAVRTTVLSPFFLMATGYTSVIIVLGIGLWLRRRLGRARKVGLT